ncbi:MAG: hypothetical protein COB85_03305 [Bacteroidetes bacterium]|nr:MAG: hypothetical protein COB85_03305 [Bacteroidota bacterium]
MKQTADSIIQRFNQLPAEGNATDTPLLNQKVDSNIVVDSGEQSVLEKAPVVVGNSNKLLPNSYGVSVVGSENVALELIDSNANIYTGDVDSLIYSEMVADCTLSPQPLMATHELLTNRGQSNHVNIKSPDWILGILLAIFLLIAWVRVYHRRRLKQLYKALTSKLYVQHILRTNDGLMQRVSFVLDIISYLVIAAFIYQVTEYYDLIVPFGSSWHPYILILLGLIILYQAKNLVLIISGLLLNQQEKLQEYRFNVFLMNKTLGLVLTPVIICIAYLSFGEAVIIWTGILFIILAYLYRINRGLVIGLKEANVSVFYLFMYLCTLEILPLVILTRLAINIE